MGMGLTEMVNLNVLRIFRVIRLLRAGRLLISVPELYILISGSSCKSNLLGIFRDVGGCSTEKVIMLKKHQKVLREVLLLPEL